MTHPDEFIDPDVQQALDAIQAVPPRDPEARARGQARFLTEARGLQHMEAPPLWQRLLGLLGIESQQKSSPAMAWRLSTLALGVTIGLVLLFSGSAATAFAAQSALPGDPLYGLKNATEDARVKLNPDAGADADLHLLFAQRRVEEIRDLISQGRFDDISIATRAFERHILQAIAALGRLAVTDPDRAAQVTDRILSSLSSYTAALTAYLENVPNGLPQHAVEYAVRASQVKFRPSEIEFAGIVSAIQVNRWVIAEKTVNITLQTGIKGTFEVGDLAEVEALVAADGTLTAQEIKPAEGDIEDRTEIEFTGTVEQITADSWIVDGRVVILTRQTKIKDAVEPGDLVRIEGLLQDNGSMTAIEIKLLQSHKEINANEADDDGAPEALDGNENDGNDGGNDDDGNENEGGDDGGDDANSNDDSNDNDSNDNSSDDNDSDDEDNRNDDADEPDEGDPNDNDSNDNEEDPEEEEPED